MVQGPPGAGKTALLYECAKRARAIGWDTAKVSIRALYDPETLAKKLNEPYVRSFTDHQEQGGEIGIDVGLKLAGHSKKGKSIEYGGRTVDEVLIEAASSQGLLLVLDEAQNLREAGQVGRDIKHALMDTLESIHNGDLGVPVVLLAGGLGTTSAVFRTFGIGRFRHGCDWLLGPLSDREVSDVLNDWLVEEGGASSLDANFLKWTTTLLSECKNWPQHLHVFACMSARWLEVHGGALPAEVPSVILSTARRIREDYYSKRVAGFSEKDLAVIAALYQPVGENIRLMREVLVAGLAAHQGHSRAEDAFKRLLHRGVLAEVAVGAYSVPIPSMHRWLFAQLAELPKTLPPSAATVSLLGSPVGQSEAGERNTQGSDSE